MRTLKKTSRAILNPEEHTIRCSACGGECLQQGLPDAPGGVRYPRHYRPGTQEECHLGDKEITKPP